jgi:hypothetical protein
MREELIAVRGQDRLFYTHDVTNEYGSTKRMGYITKGQSDVKLEVEIDVVLSRGYWEEPQRPTRDVKGKSMDWVDIATKSFVDEAPSFESKSLNYTKPVLRESIKRRIMAGSKGGAPGQWSARKAQMVAIAYREAGGGYRGGVRKTQRSLKKWTREKWRTSDGKNAIRSGGTRRYLPSSAWARLTPAQRSATNRKKIIGSRRGNQFVANTRTARGASRRARKD